MIRADIQSDEHKYDQQRRRKYNTSMVLYQQPAQAILRHWMLENYHWQDVTFQDDADGTVNYNLNILKKMALNTLRLVDVGIADKGENKHLMLCMNFSRYLDAVMAP